MSATPGTLRRVRSLLLAVGGGKSVDAREAQTLAALLAPRPKKVIQGRSLKQDREARRERMKAETAKIRKIVFAREIDQYGNSICEFCLAWPKEELHHLDSGSGKAQRQTVENCVGICGKCHRGYHRRPEDYRAAVLRWSERNGLPMPRRFTGSTP